MYNCLGVTKQLLLLKWNNKEEQSWLTCYLVDNYSTQCEVTYLFIPHRTQGIIQLLKQ